jgi:hypothetical protein
VHFRRRHKNVNARVDSEGGGEEGVARNLGQTNYLKNSLLAICLECDLHSPLGVQRALHGGQIAHEGPTDAAPGCGHPRLHHPAAVEAAQLAGAEHTT